MIHRGTSGVKRSRRFLSTCAALAAAALASGCGHSDAFNASRTDVGPSSGGADVVLTFNADQNYWPTLTSDSSAVLYQFIDVNLGSIAPRHRCMGLLPVAGGTRFWQWCDTRASEEDSSTSFAAYAVDHGGQLLYIETTTPRLFPFQTPNTTLWLADTAAPFRRRPLVTLPVVIGDSTIDWLADLTWTGPNTFVGLGQRFFIAGHGVTSFIDSVFRGMAVVRGTITGHDAALVAVPGTAGATGFSLAEDGASIVFTRLDNTNLMKVPASGGVAETVGPVTPRANLQILGVSCRGSTCVAAVGPASLSSVTGTAQPVGTGPFELRSISLATGAAATILTSSLVLSSPLLLPSGDVVAQAGAGYGRIQTFNSREEKLHLYQALVH